MGIPGLFGFLDRECQKINLIEAVAEYKKTTSMDPVLLVDISSIFHIFSDNNYQENLMMGKIKDIKKKVDDFIRHFNNLGIKLMIFFDGIRPAHKDERWLKRHLETLNDFVKVYFKKAKNNFKADCRFSSLIRVVSNSLIYSDECQCFRATYEADDKLIECLGSKNIFGSLTKDSDFLMIRGASYCFTPWDSDLNKISGYCLADIAKLLDVSEGYLPLVATLSPNDVMDEEDYTYFYEKICDENSHKFNEIAKFVRNGPSAKEILENPTKFCQEIFSGNSESVKEKFLKCLKFYLGIRKDPTVHGNGLWAEILKKAEERHLRCQTERWILNVLFQGKADYVPKFENFQLPVSVLEELLPLRKKIYSILLLEKPGKNVSVMEYSFVPEKEGDIIKIKETQTQVPIEPIDSLAHPGLLELWKDSSETRQFRLNFFFSAFDENLKPEDLLGNDLPEEFVFPILSVYLYCKVKDWMPLENPKEVIIFFAQVAMAAELTAVEISRLSYYFRLNSEALQLSSWFVTSIELLEFLNSACGNPFDRRKNDFSNFFDGRIFHWAFQKHIYKDLSWTRRHPKLCDTYNLLLSKFQFIVKKTTKKTLGKIIPETEPFSAENCRRKLPWDHSEYMKRRNNEYKRSLFPQRNNWREKGGINNKNQKKIFQKVEKSFSARTPDTYHMVKYSHPGDASGNHNQPNHSSFRH